MQLASEMAGKNRSANFDTSEKLKLAELMKDSPAIEDKRLDINANKKKEEV